MKGHYVIKKRNKNNSVFVIQRKLEGLFLIFRSLYRSKKVSEYDISVYILFDCEFFTYNKEDSSYTPVLRIGDHIRSAPNSSKADNIGNLPLI
jgi:hypothetical protein